MAEPELAPPAAAGDARPPKVIKRYTNRKLYDTVESRYVTLDEIAEMVKAGVEVQIVDNRSKEDLTSVTLAQIIFEEEKKTSKVSLVLLRDLIRSGGERLQTFLSDEVNPRVSAIREGAVHTAVGQAVAKVFKRTEGADVTLAPERAAEETPAPRDAAREFVRTSRQSMEEWQKRLDDRLKGAFATVTGLPTLHREVQALRDKLAELERKLEEHK